ncbi:small ribosomal subunit biogenesis GTPase RsgA [Mangrovitalea sediminis]|uniref:small ribosomal subunit biogenesis GTPase RsgA n=1 Tax=Mangrovitalea sediminis TaxID=1982043 RepID=UPI000BE588FB|nr:small ribosomal subunit biogenesis GTPase RsgA [Mangrovitalea sediminis]
MAKRRLNQQQQRRIRQIQSERTRRSERREQDIDRRLQAGELGPEQPGLVIAHFGRQLDVEALEGAQKGELFRCHIRANIDSLVTGDRVAWRADDQQGGVVVSRSDRRSVLLRPDNYGALKPVAANIDQIIIVIAVEPTPHANLIDRYLVAAETTGIPPVLLLNKSDLLEDSPEHPVLDLLARYQALGYTVEQTSAKRADQRAQLEALVRDRTSVFVGQSGVGKSSLIQQLAPDVDIRIGALSETTRKGTHTTTTAKLFHLPCGGDLIDSPGIREFGLWHITPDQLEWGFTDIRPLSGHCRFRNCRHQGEPGCALDEAVKDGRLMLQRRESFQRILTDIEQSSNVITDSQ